MEEKLFTEEYWEKAWLNDPNTSLKKMKKAGLGSYKSERFPKWAKNFDKTSFSDEGKKRTNRILNWIETQIGSFHHLTILDVGSASGVFSIPLAKKRARVSSLEPSDVLSDMLEKNAEAYGVDIKIINQPFETFNHNANKYDFVFASMCPAITDWKAVKKAINIAEKYVYISLMAGAKRNFIVEELMPILNVKGESTSSDMYYLLQLLYIKDYTYQSLIEKHINTVDMDIKEVISSLKTWFVDYNIHLNEQQLTQATNYLSMTYGEEVPVTTGGKFGKVLIHL